MTKYSEMSEDQKQRARAYSRAYYWRDPELGRARATVIRTRDPEKARKVYQASVRKLRQDVLNAYGGCCACCGEANPGFLTLDHVNNDGAEHRRMLRNPSSIWREARKLGYPDRFQVLCANCNLGKHWNGGVCPHQGGDAQ